MKLKYLFLTLFAAAAFAFTACEEKEADVAMPDCRFNVDSLKFDSSADVRIIKLAANRDWTISCDSSFVGIDIVKGDASDKAQYIEISVTKNNGFDRSAKVFANAGRGLSKDLLIVSQKGPKGNEDDALLITIKQFLEKADTQNPWVIEGTISGVNTQYSYFWLEQDGSKVEIYQPVNFSEFQIAEGGTAKVKGVYEKYTNKNTGAVTHELAKGTILKYTAPSTTPTADAIFSETFATSLGNFTQQVKSGNVTNVWTADTQHTCAKATAYVQLEGETKKTNHASEAWLVSPQIDLTAATAATLVFDHAANTYFASLADDITLWASSDGGEYKQLMIPTYPTASNSYPFVSSGNISLKDFLGHKLTIAFVYKSTDAKTGTYELKNFVVNKEDTGETKYVSTTVCETLAQVAALGDNAKFEYNKGALVVARTTGGVVLNDGSTTLYAYGETTAAIGDKVNLKGTKTTYRGLPELTFAKEDLSVASSGNPVSYPTVKDITAGFDNYTATTYEYISFTGVLTTSTNAAGTTTYYNVTVAGATVKGSIQLPEASLNIANFVNKQVKLTGYFAGSNTTNNNEKLHNIFLTAIEESGASYLNVSATAFSVKASDTSVSFNVGGNVDWTASCSAAGVTVSPASGNGAATVTVSFPANTDTENDKTFNVVVSTTSACTPNSYTVAITQKKAGSASQEVINVSFATIPTSDFPSGSAAGLTDGTYTLEGQSFVFKASTKFYWNTDGYLLIGKANSYILLPAIAGKKLTQVKFKTGDNASTSVVVDIYKGDGSASMGVNSTALNKGTEYTWTVNGEVGAQYQIRVCSAHNAQFKYLELSYE